MLEKSEVVSKLMMRSSSTVQVNVSHLQTGARHLKIYYAHAYLMTTCLAVRSKKTLKCSYCRQYTDPLGGNVATKGKALAAQVHIRLF